MFSRGINLAAVSQDVESSLFSWYDFGKTSKFEVDESAERNNLTEVGTVTKNTPSLLGEGISGFHINPYPFVKAETGDFSFLNTNYFHVFVWVNLSITGTHYVASKWRFNDGSRGWFLRIVGPGTVEFTVSADGLFDASQTVTIPYPTDNEWHLVEAIFDGENGLLKLAVDGEGFAENSTTVSSIYASDAPLMIGGVQNTLDGSTINSNEAFNGTIDQIVIFERPVSSATRKFIYNQGVGQLFDLHVEVFFTILTRQKEGFWPSEKKMLQRLATACKKVPGLWQAITTAWLPVGAWGDNVFRALKHPQGAGTLMVNEGVGFEAADWNRLEALNGEGKPGNTYIDTLTTENDYAPSDNTHIMALSESANSRETGFFRDVGTIGSNTFQLIIRFNELAYYRSFDNLTLLDNLPNTEINGVFVGTRLPEDVSHFWRNSTLLQTGNPTTPPQAPVGNNIGIFRANNNQSDKKLAAASLGEGISISQHSKYEAVLQRLRSDRANLTPVYPIEDIFSSYNTPRPDFAVSTRLIIPEYEGPLFRAIRAGDPATFIDVMPDPETGYFNELKLQEFFDANPGVAIDLDRWYDQVGGGYMSQLTAAARPFIKTAGESNVTNRKNGNLLALEFSGNRGLAIEQSISVGTISTTLYNQQSDPTRWGAYHALLDAYSSVRIGGILEVNNVGFHNNATPSNVKRNGESRPFDDLSPIEQRAMVVSWDNPNLGANPIPGLTVGNFDTGTSGGRIRQSEILVWSAITNIDQIIIDQMLASGAASQFALADGSDYALSDGSDIFITLT